jgi:hypothetical protein
MSDFDLTLSPETIQEITNASDRNLTAPSPEVNPTFRQGKAPGLGSWAERVKIHDTSINPVKSDPTNSNKFNFVLVLSVQGPDDGGYATNAGRPHYQYFYMDKTGLASADPKVSGGYKRRLGVINSLLAACGVDLSSGVPSYAAYFTGDKPLVGITVNTVFRKYLNERTGETGIDIDGFTAAS